MNDELITQLGLLLTQTRFARRALEDIERSTSTYASFAFTSVIAAGPKFGEPPLFEGALRVHVVNINDLSPGGGFGSLLEGLLGGVGRFVGNIPGGLVGGTVGSLSLIGSLPTILQIAQSVERILDRLGVGQGFGSKDPQKPSDPGGQLTLVKTALDGLTALFLAAGGKPEQAAGVSELPETAAGRSWLRLADAATASISSLSRLVDGLVLALPMVTGALAWLLSRLGDIRVAIAETLRFLLREALLLRGTLLVTVFDTLASIARLGAAVLGILQSTVDGIVAALFTTVREALLTAFDLVEIIGDAIKSTVDKVLNWLVPTVDTILRNFGDLRVFRVVTHLVRILPAILPVIFELKNNTPLENQARLNNAADLPFLKPLTPGSTTASGTGAPLLPDPDLRLDPALTRRFLTLVDQEKNTTLKLVDQAAGGAQAGLGGVSGVLEKAVTSEAKLSDARLEAHLGQVRESSGQFSANLVVGERIGPKTGLEAVANAYEQWLTGGGLNTLLGRITQHFTGAEGQPGIPQHFADEAAGRRASVRIDEVVIELDGPAVPRPAPEPATPVPAGPGDYPSPPGRDEMARYARMWFDHDQRGGSGRLPFPT